MLAPLTDYKHGITLIQDSGIQFLDFALTPLLDAEFPGKFVRKTASGPLLRLQWEAESGKYQLPAVGNQAAEVVRPEFSYPLQQSLRLLDKLWLPLPFLRHIPAGLFCRARTTGRACRWCSWMNRIRTATCCAWCWPSTPAPPRPAKRLWRRAKAIRHRAELRAGAPQPRAGRVSRSDLGRRLAARSVQPARRRAGAARRSGDQRRAENLRVSGALPQSAAHARPSAGGTADKMVAATLQQPAIDVDLVLDVGNSHTCGVLVEDHPEESNGLKQTYELQLRSLSEPHRVYNELFESRVEFSQASFGKPHLSFQSGRDDAFQWPSITRVGREAAQLAQRRTGHEGTTGISSPRRYLWDEERYAPGWRFNERHEPMAAAAR